MAVEVGKVPENPAYNIADIRFEHEAGGYVTIWFDIDGPSFEEPEVMKNIFVGFDEFLDNLKAQQLALYNTLNEKRVEQHWQWLERLDASGFDWKRYLRGYIDQCVDLRAAEVGQHLFFRSQGGAAWSRAGALEELAEVHTAYGRAAPGLRRSGVAITFSTQLVRGLPAGAAPAGVAASSIARSTRGT